MPNPSGQMPGDGIRFLTGMIGCKRLNPYPSEFEVSSMASCQWGNQVRYLRLYNYGVIHPRSQNVMKSRPRMAEPNVVWKQVMLRVQAF